MAIHASLKPTALLILAGGRAQRMGGIDKAFYQHAGSPLINHAMQLSRRFENVWVASGRSAERYKALNIDTLADAIPGFAGPLSGLIAGFRRLQRGVLLSMPVDLLGPTGEDLQRLLDTIKADERCRYAIIAGRHQPLLAAWRVDSELIELAEQRLQRGAGSVYQLQDEIDAQPLDFGERSAHWQNLNKI